MQIYVHDLLYDYGRSRALVLCSVPGLTYLQKSRETQVGMFDPRNLKVYLKFLGSNMPTLVSFCSPSRQDKTVNFSHLCSHVSLAYYMVIGCLVRV